VYLHLGQNRGKSSSTVCGRTCVLVLPPHLGQRSQSDPDGKVSVISYHLPVRQGRRPAPFYTSFNMHQMMRIAYYTGKRQIFNRVRSDLSAEVP